MTAIDIFERWHCIVVTIRASLRTHPKSQFWIACFSRSDGTRTQRSTRVPVAGNGGGDTKAFQILLGKILGADVTITKASESVSEVGPKEARKLAQRIADAFEETARTAATGRLIESQARKVVGDIHMLANGKSISSSTVQDYLDAWLTRKEVEAGSKTHAKYSSVVRQFKEYLGPKVRRDLTAITASDITGFRNALVKRVTIGTTNVALKIIRSAFAQARRDGLIDVNEAEKGRTFEADGQCCTIPAPRVYLTRVETNSGGCKGRVARLNSFRLVHRTKIGRCRQSYLEQYRYPT